MQANATTCPERLRLMAYTDDKSRACRDADRLDLGRVGIRPHPNRLCTDAARDPAAIRAAVSMSEGRPRLRLQNA